MTTFAICVRIARGVDPPSRVRLALAGITSGFAMPCEYPSLVCVIALTIYAARVVPYRLLVWVALGALGPVIMLTWYHAAGFGAPWHLPYEYSVQTSQRVGLLGLGTPSATALWHLTVSPFRGLFFSAPWLLLAAPGAVRMWRGGARDEVVACVVIFVLSLWITISYNVWHGGRAVGPRHLVPALPFLVILASGWISDAKVPRLRYALLAILVAWSGFLMVAATAVQPEVDASIKRPFGDYVLPKLAQGELAVSQQSIDMPVEGPTGTHYAWNLGQKLGLSGLVSLVPLLAWWAVAGIWLRRRSSPPTGLGAPRLPRVRRRAGTQRGPSRRSPSSSRLRQ